jgi:hypothetical protein
MIPRLLASMAMGAVAVALSNPAAADGVLRTVLVIDASSSMRATDPKELRKVAAELFVDLTRDGDQLAVVGFDGASRDSMPALVTIRGPGDRDAVKRAIRAVGNDGNWTDFTAGFDGARRVLLATPRGQGDQDLVLFLTDGRCDPDPRGPIVEAAKALGRGQIENRTGLSGACHCRTTRGARQSARLCRGLIEERSSCFFGRTWAKNRWNRRGHRSRGRASSTFCRYLRTTFRRSSRRGTCRVDHFRYRRRRSIFHRCRVGWSSQTRPAALRSRGRRGRQGECSPRSHLLFGRSQRIECFRIEKPSVGSYRLDVGARGTGGRYAVLQNFDMDLDLPGLPELVEVGKPLALTLRLATPGGKASAVAFSARHSFSLAVVEGASACDDAALDHSRLRLRFGLVPTGRTRPR